MAVNDMKSGTYDFNQNIRSETYRQLYKDWDYPEPLLTVVENAFILPQEVQTVEHDLTKLNQHIFLTFNGGAYDAEGKIIRRGLHEGMLGLRHVPDHFEPPKNPARLEGSWLYGGILFRHVGHMLTESIGRIWPFGELGANYDGIVFVGMNGAPILKAGESIEDWVQQSTQTTLSLGLYQKMLDIFDIRVPVRIVGAPVQVERLTVPTQLMGLLPYNELLGGHPKYRAHVHSSIPKFIVGTPKPTSNRIFISRSRFYKPSSASLFMEDRLDYHFESAGYQVVYPELLDLRDQISIYASASHIVLAAGSAAHVVSLAMNGTQNVALIQRYANQNDQFSPQLRAMCANSVIMLKVLTGVFLPASQVDRDKFGFRKSMCIYDLDLKKLWRELEELGFVSNAVILDNGDRRMAAFNRITDELKQSHGYDFDLLPLEF